MDFDVKTITNYRDQGFSWRNIAAIYKVDVKQLYNWRENVGFKDPRPGNPCTYFLDVNEISEMRKRGKPWKEIAVEKKVSKSTIVSWKNSIGFVDPLGHAGHKGGKAPTIIYKLKEDYINGATIPELMEKYDKPYQTIYNYVLGCKSVDEQVKTADHGKAMALRRAGWTVKDIAEDLHISEKAVKIVLRIVMQQQKCKRA